MRILSQLFFIATSVILISSCTVYNKVHFNKDYSGTYSMQLDMESLMMLGSMMDSTGTMSEDAMVKSFSEEVNRDSIQDVINTMEGISGADVNITKEDGFVIKFDFKDLPSLNNAFATLQSQMGDMTGGMDGDALPQPEPYDAFMNVGKKTLVFKSPPKDEDAEDMLFPEGEGGEEDMLGQIGEFFEMKLDFSFDRKVKSVEAKGIEILAQESNRILADVKMDEAISGDGYEIIIKLK